MREQIKNLRFRDVCKGQDAMPRSEPFRFKAEPGINQRLKGLMGGKPVDDHERFTNEMNLAFELLENLIRELPVTLPKQDLLFMYARQLKDAAYQAGKSEKKEE